MREAGIGRVLVASLHQGIADILPTRLAFYENWLSVEGLREGTIGLAPLFAVLSFLRQEGEAGRAAPMARPASGAAGRTRHVPRESRDCANAEGDGQSRSSRVDLLH